MSNLLEFEYSPWLLFFCVALGAAYAYIHYQKKSPWSRKINRLLAFGRGVLVAVLAILLLGPTLRSVRNFYEQPLLVMAIDNSESVALTTDSTILQNLTNSLGLLTEELQARDWQVKQVELNGEAINLDSLRFNTQRSNLTGMIRSVQSEYKGANLGAILVVSDGIFNSGFSPDLISTFTPIYGLGLGDTISRKDLSLINLRHNKTVYQDNKFPVEVSVRNEGLGPANTLLKIYQGGILQDQVQLPLTPETRLIKHQFLVNAKGAGKQRISIVLDAIDGESTIINNSASFYIDVIEGQQKVLIVADAPSPDIKALRLAIQKNEHFAVDVKVSGEISSTDYDLIILIQSPNKGVGGSVYHQLLGSEIPKLYLLGSQTNIVQLNKDGIVNFRQLNSQYDQVTAVFNNEFKGFTIASEKDEWFANVPPLTVPFGTIILQPTDQVLLYQRVGTVITQQPIIYFSELEPKLGVIIGEGLWKWRLNEYRKYNETIRFDELVTKTIMFLAAKPDKRQFKMYPLKDGYEVGEEINFVAESYNELFEPLYGELVSLKIVGSNSMVRNYTFTPLLGSRQMTVDDLAVGIYSYEAFTTLNGKRHLVSGEFSVEKPDLEAADLTADYVMLRKLAHESGGEFYSGNAFDKLSSDLLNLESPAIIHTQERERLLISLPWILIILIMLASGEWLTRKMMGGY